MSKIKTDALGKICIDTAGKICICPDGYTVVFPEGHSYPLTEVDGIYTASDTLIFDFSEPPLFANYNVENLWLSLFANGILPNIFTVSLSIEMVIDELTGERTVTVDLSGTASPNTQTAASSTDEIFADGTTFNLSDASSSPAIRYMDWV